MEHSQTRHYKHTNQQYSKEKEYTHSLADWEKPVKMETLYISTHTCQMLMNFLPSFFGPLDPRDAGRMAWNPFKGASLLHTGFVQQAVDCEKCVQWYEVDK